MANKASADDFEESATGAQPKMAPEDHLESSQKGNAFAELMKSKPKAAPSSPHKKKKDKRFADTMAFGRDGLVAYTRDPGSFSHNEVVYFNDKFVVINDLFPKATVHLLILPRDSAQNVQRGQEAFDDPQFLADCVAEEKKVRLIVASELRRKLGRYSATDKPYLEALTADDLPDPLPAGRDWDKEIISGTHANPSMNHLHIHVLSRDLHSECMKKTNHYQSFTTDFLISMPEYPLAQADTRRDYGWFPREMICWRCGKNFGNKMTRLKEHLEEEFEDWRKE